MGNIRFSKQIILTTLRDVAKEHPDYVYDTSLTVGDCMYSTPGGLPSCIVGHVIKRLDPETFDHIHREEWEFNDYDEAIANPRAVDELFDDGELPGWSDKAKNILHEAQRVQDRGQPWLDAYKAAKAVA